MEDERLEVLTAAEERGHFVKEDAKVFGKAALSGPMFDDDVEDIDLATFDCFSRLTAWVAVDDAPIVGAARDIGLDAEVQSFDGETSRVVFSMPVVATI